MSFDWREYLQLARRLIEPPASNHVAAPTDAAAAAAPAAGTASAPAATVPAGVVEAAKRAAISRAYYAAYNMTRRFLLIQARGEGSHKAVWTTAGNDSREQVQRAAKKGWKLKERREMADYEPRMEALDYRLTESLELAQQILDLLYPPSPPSSATPSTSPPSARSV